MEEKKYSDKSWFAALMLSLFLGTFGVDRFYLGKAGSGLAKLLTFGGFLVWTFIDFILILTNSLKDHEGLPLKK